MSTTSAEDHAIYSQAQLRNVHPMAAVAAWRAFNESGRNIIQAEEISSFCDALRAFLDAVHTKDGNVVRGV